MMETHQHKLRQSCREYHAIEVGDLVGDLRMTRKGFYATSQIKSLPIFTQHTQKWHEKQQHKAETGTSF